MKSNRNHKLFSRLIAHVEGFWRRTCGLPRHCVVALSGGKDSTLLLEVVAALGQRHGFNVRACHIDHGTQAQQPHIEAALKQQCRRLNIELVIKRTHLDVQQGNFEARARQARLALLQQDLAANEVIVFGHHIDDSYEWAWLQSLRAGTLYPSLGIPVCNGKKQRPFLCLTRAQIERLHRRFALWSFDDVSNGDQRFARNHLRQLLQREIAPRYPNYLKHYVVRANDLAKRLGVSAFKRSELVIQRAPGICLVRTLDPRGHEEELVGLHRELSTLGRSSVRQEIEKLTASFGRGRMGMRQLPGKVEVWPLAETLLFTTQRARQQLQAKWSIASQIPEINSLTPQENAIFVAVWDAPQWLRKHGLKSHPLVTMPSDVVLLPWSRMVKLWRNRPMKLRWKALNI